MSNTSDSLCNLLKEGVTLDPLIVWKDPKDPESPLLVVDGHLRMRAYVDTKTRKDRLIWVQLVTVESQGEARALATEINSRERLKMRKDEVVQEYWLKLLAGEVDCRLSTRDRGKIYGISKDTVNRMDHRKDEFLAKLHGPAGATGQAVDTAFIRAHADEWRKVLADDREWQTGSGDDWQARKEQEIDQTSLDIQSRFGDMAKKHPDIFKEGLKRVLEEWHWLRLDVRDIPLREDGEDEETEF